ncbi:pimeloyl-ACP methyl ester esterase BioH [uncultured Thiohalocapsa sp.]|uniref:pimeloyl-ACP methyl ester esterase BioH n=1 Tax=uncultured Thiohalocapsa sp. TaxID=768990 RepID=UPI0025D60DAD|nr:pimeloyl-ACP methyl ester esterase BioH [uncultured Thiohalocapsa sp.]
MKVASSTHQPVRTPLVLVHGWGMNAGVWAGLPEAITQRFAPLAVDLPGHGGAPFSAGQWSLDHWAQACLDQVSARSPAGDHTPAVWLGWSLGGLVALQAARLAPDRVRALVLLAATPRFVRAVDWQVAVPEGTLGQFHDGLLADPQGTLERFLALQVRGADDARALLRRLRAGLAGQPAADPAALAQGLQLLREEDLRGPLPDIRPPTLWLFGERDTLVPAAAAERVALLMPEARMQVLAGAAHAPWLSHGGATAAAMIKFLDSIGL